VGVYHRGTVAWKWCSESSTKRLTLTYDPETTSFSINNQKIVNDDLVTLFADAANGIVLEATTLGFVEMAHCCKSILAAGHKSVYILYVEPLRYFVPHATDKILLKRDFALTDEVHPFSGVPGWIRRLTSDRRQHITFFLGFEGQRLDQAIEQLIVAPQNCSVVFGVPAFRPGWEMNAFANNIDRINESKLRGGVSFCGADNPAAVVQLLSELRKTPDDLFAVPIGTKPHAIGVALFAATDPNIGLIYDFPERKLDRSQSEAMWHIFEVQF
jgi:hypothetical protein